MKVHFQFIKFTNIFGKLIKEKMSKVSKWMENYTSRQIAPKLYREDTGLACASRAFLWRKGKRIGKKVKIIINEDSFYRD